MNTQTRMPKVLRIGIVLDGKIVQERFVKAGETVTVGESSRNTFQIPATALGAAEFPLFAWRDDRYHLQFNEQMSGKVSTTEGVVVLDKARRDPGVERQDGLFVVKLSDTDRGKVAIKGAGKSSLTVLFQFVTAPAMQAVIASEDLSFRPRLIEDDDPALLVSVGFWGALGIVFALWAINSERPEMELQELPDRFTKIALAPAPERAEPVEDRPREDTRSDETVARKADAAEETAVKRDEPKTKAEQVEQAQRVQQAKDQLMAQSAAVLQMLGTMGEHGRGTVRADNAMGDLDALSGKLAQLEGGTTLADPSRVRRGSGVEGGKGVRDIGGVEAGGDRTVAVEAAPQVKVQPKVSTGSLDFGGEQVKGLEAVIRTRRGQLQYCYESSLKTNPNLSGRVVVAWEVINERAEDLYIHTNTTGDDAFARCLMDKIKRWPFRGVDDGPAKMPLQFSATEG